MGHLMILAQELVWSAKGVSIKPGSMGLLGGGGGGGVGGGVEGVVGCVGLEDVTRAVRWG